MHRGQFCHSSGAVWFLADVSFLISASWQEQTSLRANWRLQNELSQNCKYHIYFINFPVFHSMGNTYFFVLAIKSNPPTTTRVAGIYLFLMIWKEKPRLCQKFLKQLNVFLCNAQKVTDTWTSRQKRSQYERIWLCTRCVSFYWHNSACDNLRFIHKYQESLRAYGII